MGAQTDGKFISHCEFVVVFFFLFVSTRGPAILSQPHFGWGTVHETSFYYIMLASEIGRADSH
jgi:hypothetical protein